jgi:hypothetical protein
MWNKRERSERRREWKAERGTEEERNGRRDGKRDLESSTVSSIKAEGSVPHDGKRKNGASDKRAGDELRTVRAF